MSESVSIERRRILKALGAEIILTSKKKGTDGAIDKAHEIVNKNKNKYFMPNQFANDYNPLAHYETTAKEIIDQTRGRVGIIIAAMGTTGTLMGVSKRIKEFNPNIKIIGVEPYPNHKLQGMKSLEESYVPKIYDEKRLDEKVKIKDEEAIRITRELALKEGILVGMSSGAIIAVALKKAKELDNKKVIVAILPDGGERYLTTTLFN
jgi:cysteine synthase